LYYVPVHVVNVSVIHLNNNNNSDTEVPSYLDRTLQAVFHAAEIEKRQKYLAACQDIQAGFTPLCFSVDGMLGIEAGYLMCQLTVLFCVGSGRCPTGLW